MNKLPSFFHLFKYLIRKKLRIIKSNKYCLGIGMMLVMLCTHVQGEEYKWEKISDFVSQQSYSTSAEYSQMGYSLDVLGDYAVVGLPGILKAGAGGGYGFHGQAYVLKKNLGSWQIIATFRPNRDETINFGIEVSISEDLIAIGAVSGQNYRDSAVYLFEKVNGEWQDSEAVSTLTGQSYYDRRSFGSAIDISGDLIVIGSKSHTLDQGAIYVYEKPVSGWKDANLPNAKLTTSSGLNGASLGENVIIAQGRILTMGLASKSLLIYEKNASQWEDMTESQSVDLQVSFPNHHDYHLQVDGNIVVISAPSYLSDQSGKVVVLESSGNSFTLVQEINPIAEVDVNFGALTAIENNNLVILSRGASTSLSNLVDTLYFYEKDISNQWIYTSTHEFNNDYEGNRFEIGERMQLENGKLYLGFPGDSSVALNAGAFHEYTLSAGAIGSPTQLLYSQGQDSFDFSYFGQALDIEGDVAVVGAPGEDDYRGAVYILERSNKQWQQVAKLIPSDLMSWSLFGFSVAIHGDTIAIGSPRRMDSNSKGKVYIYKKPLLGWQQMDASYEITQDIIDPENILDDFGGSIDLFEERLAVGGNDYNNSSVYIYELSHSDASEVHVLTDTSNNFGRSLKWIDNGSRLVVASDANLITVYADYFGNWSKQALLVSSDIFARFTHIEANDNWIIAGSYTRYGSDTDINTIMFKKPDVGWRNMNETQIIQNDVWYSKNGASIALDNNSLAIWANNELEIYTEENNQWQKVASTPAPYPYVGVYIDRANAFEYPVNHLAYDNGSILAGRFWENTTGGIFAGQVDEYQKKLAATVTFNNIGKKLSDGLFTLTASSNSSGSISFEIIGGDESAITLNDELVEMHHTGTVEIKATVASTADFASASVTATLIIDKGVATISNFNDMTLFKGFPAVTLNVISNSDGAISYSPLAFISSSGSFDMGLDLVNGDQLSPNRAGTLYLRAIVAETDQYLSEDKIIVVLIIDM